MKPVKRRVPTLNASRLEVWNSLNDAQKQRLVTILFLRLDKSI